LLLVVYQNNYSLPCALALANQKRIVGFALKSRSPAMYAIREFVDGGGLMSYGAAETDRYRRVAYYVERILKGAKPADLPVERRQSLTGDQCKDGEADRCDDPPASARPGE
jgi:hypothetical protein